jgi:HCOMODA/2-hydroxy-3-carboxy-muconic semialdehyde decarboxylase
VDLGEAIEELVTANRILAREGVVDAFGHASIRSPANRDRYFLSRARAPELIERDDIIEFTLDGAAVAASDRVAYAERHIHGAIYERRPDVMAVVHSHSPSTIPFGVTGTRLRPLMHMCAGIGTRIPIWDSRHQFGDSNLLVVNMDMGRDLAAVLGGRPVTLMRGHGCVVAGGSLREVVFNSVYLEVNADLQLKSQSLGGDIIFLSDGEVEAIIAKRKSFTFERAWERWCLRAGPPYDYRPMEGPLER